MAFAVPVLQFMLFRKVAIFYAPLQNYIVAAV
jgi:hypothetical protein